MNCGDFFRSNGEVFVSDKKSGGDDIDSFLKFFKKYKLKFKSNKKKFHSYLNLKKNGSISISDIFFLNPEF